MPIAISAEQRALVASIREWAARAGTLALVRGLEPGSTAGTPGGQAGSPASPAGPPGATAGAVGPLGSPAGAVETLIAAVGAGGRPAGPAVAGQVGAVVASGLAGSLMDLRAALAELAGAGDTHQAAVRKLGGVAHRQVVAETALVPCGPDGAASDGPAGDAGYAFLLSRCLSIAGGTSQILLSVVAERALGLPRDEAR